MISWNLELSLFELTMHFNPEKIENCKDLTKILIKWNFQLTMFEVAMPDLYMIVLGVTVICGLP